MKSEKYVTTPSQIPQGEHWAIIEAASMCVPGDERSRQNPGHGYPEYTHNYTVYTAYTNEEEFKKEMEIRYNSTYSRPAFIGIHVQGVYFPKRTIELTEKK
jgi:hypothetical protein